MPLVLTTNALVLCPHGGKGTTIPLSPKWTVNGGFVAADGDSGTLACPFLPLPCVGYQLQSMGLNATQIDGKNAILVTDFNQTFTGLPLVMTDFHQTNDQSTPAPIPAGQSAPPATPAMADLVSPAVTAAPNSVPFSISTTTTPVVVSFALASDHPLRWILTLINEPMAYHLDLTNGAPGATVAPSGGSWTTPALAVTITMLPTFVAALSVGKSHLYLTGVSQRGLSGYGQGTIIVSP
jgi:hypothetical protein